MNGSLITIAHITRPQGLHGQVRIRIDFDDPDLFERGAAAELVLGERAQPTTIESCRLQHGRWVAKFEGVDSIEDAEKWIGASLRVPRKALGDAGDGGYFSFDLEGCTVWAGNEVLGIVKEVLDSGGGSMLRLEGSGSDGAGNEILVPFVREYLKGVDVVGKRIDVELPEGLADLNG